MKFRVGNEFWCVQCGHRGLPVVRVQGKEREAGHLKKLYCLNEKKETNHVERVEFTHYDRHNFFEEYYGNNFTEDGLRKQEYSQFKNQLIKENKWEDLQKIVEEVECEHCGY